MEIGGRSPRVPPPRRHPIAAHPTLVPLVPGKLPHYGLSMMLAPYKGCNACVARVASEGHPVPTASGRMPAQKEAMWAHKR
jgi:hypothetical protein